MKKIILAGALGIAALAGTNLPGLEATKASAASIELDLTTIEGRVVEVNNNVISVETQKYSKPISIYLNSKPNIKIDDYVKATGSMFRNFTEYMIATSVEKILTNNNAFHTGMYYKENGQPEFVVGKVIRVDKYESDIEEPLNYVIIEYSKSNGDKDIVEVDLTQGQKFNVNDIVKVDFNETSDFHSITINASDGIERIGGENNNDINIQTEDTDRWVWS